MKDSLCSWGDKQTGRSEHIAAAESTAQPTADRHNWDWSAIREYRTDFEDSFCLFYVSSRSIRADFLIFYGKYEIFDNYCGNRSLPEPYRSPFLLQFCDRRCLVPDLRALSHPNRWSKNIYDKHKLCPKLSVISSVMNWKSGQPWHTFES